MLPWNSTRRALEALIRAKSHAACLGEGGDLNSQRKYSHRARHDHSSTPLSS
jgi:hypothetical protein